MAFALQYHFQGSGFGSCGQLLRCNSLPGVPHQVRRDPTIAYHYRYIIMKHLLDNAEFDINAGLFDWFPDDEKQTNNRTLLMSNLCYRSTVSQPCIVKLLVDHGADPNVQDSDGETVLLLHAVDQRLF